MASCLRPGPLGDDLREGRCRGQPREPVGQGEALQRDRADRCPSPPGARGADGRRAILARSFGRGRVGGDPRRRPLLRPGRPGSRPTPHRVRPGGQISLEGEPGHFPRLSRDPRSPRRCGHQVPQGAPQDPLQGQARVQGGVRAGLLAGTEERLVRGGQRGSGRSLPRPRALTRASPAISPRARGRLQPEPPGMVPRRPGGESASLGPDRLGSLGGRQPGFGRHRGGRSRAGPRRQGPQCAHRSRGAGLRGQVPLRSALPAETAVPVALVVRILQVRFHPRQPMCSRAGGKDPRQPCVDLCPRAGQLRRAIRGVGGPGRGMCHWKARPGPSRAGSSRRRPSGAQERSRWADAEPSGCGEGVVVWTPQGRATLHLGSEWVMPSW